jgi:16S rRNA (cytosine1402-N4)-methyltransferase
MSQPENRHLPVLLQETIDAFLPLGEREGAVIVDGTLGGAGHTFGLLARFAKLHILGCDMDLAAIEAARERLNTFFAEKRVDFFHGNFTTLGDLEVQGIPDGYQAPWDGVLLDLGYSSNQLESSDYGMSFQVDAPLDMRLARPIPNEGPGSQSAWDLMDACSAQELGDIIKAYGEMPGAHKLARQIHDAIEIGKIKNSTADFARFLESISPRRSKDQIHPATLVFQALRIAVNDELRVLDHFLDGVILNKKLKLGARMAVITFHSLEDRVVKRWGQKHTQHLRPLTKKPVTATAEEIKANPRSRSAKLRVYERI